MNNAIETVFATVNMWIWRFGEAVARWHAEIIAVVFLGLCASAVFYAYYLFTHFGAP